MKHSGTLLLALCCTLGLSAQDSLPQVQTPTSEPPAKFGYMNYNSVLELMPEYIDATERYQQVVAEFEEEIARNDNEFQRKYVEFLQAQSQMSGTILIMRQKELQQLSDNSLAFKRTYKKLLEQEKESIMNPVYLKLEAAIGAVAAKMELDYVIDQGASTFLYIGSRGTDISEEVCRELGIVKNGND